MWMNGYERPKPDRIRKDAILRPEGAAWLDKMVKKAKTTMARAKLWINRNTLWIVLMAVCALAFITINTIANQERRHPSVGGEIFVFAIPVLIWWLTNDDER